MGALRTGWFALLLALAIPSLVHAQAAGLGADPVTGRAGDAEADADADAEADADADADADASPDDAARGSSAALDPDSVASADELPDGADFGPALSERPPLLTAEEERLARIRNFDPTEPEHPVVIQVYAGLGVALDASLDGVLSAHRYGSSPLVIAGDVSFLGRINEWLYLGGRLGARGRGWGSNDDAPAVAGGIDAMAIAHARTYLGRVVDIGAVLGIGVAWAGVSMQGGGSAALAPRLHGSGVIAFRIDSGVRFSARFGWDWYSLYDLDRYGSDLELGGPSLAIGIEVRR